MIRYLHLTIRGNSCKLVYLEVDIMYEDAIDHKSLQEQFEASLDNAFRDFYASRALDPFVDALKDDFAAALRLAFLAGYQAAGGRPPAAP